MISIRDAAPADIDTLVEFNAAMAQESEHMALDPATLRAGVAALLAEAQRGFYLVAEDAGNVVGCLMITHEWSDWRNADWWWLQSVYVRAGHRRRGVFRALCNDVEQRARRASGVAGLRLYVERDNVHAQRTYASLGMRETHYRMWEKVFVGTEIDPR